MVWRLLVALAVCLALLPAAPAAGAAELWEPLYLRDGPARGPTIDLRAVGDVMLGRQVARAATERGWERVFAAVAAGGEAPLLGGDLTIGNLESPLAEERADPADPLQLIGPPDAAPALAAAGFDLLGLANNHAYDAGAAGLAATHTTLAEAGIDAPGVGATAGAAVAPVRRTLNGLELALFAASDVAGRRDPPAGQRGWRRAGLDEPFFAAVRGAEATADLTVVLVHWGQEYHERPAERQRLLAAELVAAGADLIVGAHPHVLQPYAVVEAEGNKGVVLYSLGNFLFDQLTRWDTSTGAVARVLLDRDGVVALGAAPVDLVGWQLRALPRDSYEGRQGLRAMGATLAPEGEAAPHPTLQGWSWDGGEPEPVKVPRRANPIVHPRALYVDLIGTGEPQLVTLDGETVRVYAGPDDEAPIAWESTVYGWPITRIAAGDPDNDGRYEVAMLVHKPDRDGAVRVHPFLLGYRGGRYRIIWGGSPRPATIRDLAIGDLDGDRANELVFLEGPAAPTAPATRIVIFRWDGWFFYEEARLTGGRWFRIEARDLDRDGRLELVADRLEG